ncbi:MAG: hypothetical protein WC855_04830 [Thermodesulfovibrionales bacterium]
MKKIPVDLKNMLTKALPFIGILALINFIIYHDYWLGNIIFSGKDTLTQYMPFINFQSDCLKEFIWPLWNPFMNFGFPYVELNKNFSFFPTHLLMGLLTGFSMIIYQREVLLWIMIGGIGGYLCVREFGHSWIAAAVDKAIHVPFDKSERADF